MRSVYATLCGVVLTTSALVAGTAAAAERGISIPPGGIAVQGTATVSSTVTLPNTATPVMIINFVLPPDYVPDSVVKVQLHAQQPVGACSVVLDVVSSTRRRNNLPSSNLGGGVQAAGNNPVISFAGAAVVRVKSYLVKTPSGISITGTNPGDSITIRLDRLVDKPEDNCEGPLFIAGIQVIYESAL